MTLFDKYLVRNVPHSPDDPAVAADPPAPVVDPAIVAAVDPPAPEPQPEPEPAPPPVQKTQMVPLPVVDGLRAKNRGLETDLQQTRRQLAEAQALADRLSRAPNPDGTQQPPPAPRVDPAPSEEADIDRRADYKLFLRDVGAMRDRGMTQYGGSQFGDTIRALAAVGADTDEFVSQVLAVDQTNAHVLLRDISQDLEKAATLVAMHPTRRIAELTRMAMTAAAATDPKPADPVIPAPKPAATAPKVVSRAPAPPPPVDSVTTKTVDWRDDKASDDEFSRGWDENQKQRMSFRR